MDFSVNWQKNPNAEPICTTLREVLLERVACDVCAHRSNENAIVIGLDKPSKAFGTSFINGPFQSVWSQLLSEHPSVPLDMGKPIVRDGDQILDIARRRQASSFQNSLRVASRQSSAWKAIPQIVTKKPAPKADPQPAVAGYGAPPYGPQPTRSYAMAAGSQHTPQDNRKPAATLPDDLTLADYKHPIVRATQREFDAKIEAQNREIAELKRLVLESESKLKSLVESSTQKLREQQKQIINDEMDDLEEFVGESLDITVESLIHSVSQGVASANQKIRHSAFRGCFDLEQRLEMLEEHADATSEFLQAKIGKEAPVANCETDESIDARMKILAKEEERSIAKIPTIAQKMNEKWSEECTQRRRQVAKNRIERRKQRNLIVGNEEAFNSQSAESSSPSDPTQDTMPSEAPEASSDQGSQPEDTELIGHSESIEEAILEEPLVPTPPEPLMIPASVINKNSKRKETSPRNDSDWTEASGRKAAKQRKPSSPIPSPKCQTQPANRFDALSTLDEPLEDGEIPEESDSASPEDPSPPDLGNSPQEKPESPSPSQNLDEQLPDLSPSETSTPEKSSTSSALSSPPFASLSNKSLFADEAKLAELASSLSSEADDDSCSTDPPPRSKMTGQAPRSHQSGLKKALPRFPPEARWKKSSVQRPNW